ncbi:MAG: hypothetical protein IKV67_03300 [Paludibacteraceae bacterium]|nr:hypothetical protein [Paludibacteraceae bacterium]
MVNVFCLFSVLGATTSCKDEYVGESSDNLGAIEKGTVDKETFGNTIILGKKLNNPYSLKNMQAAYDSLCRASGVATRSVDMLQPTHLYVRFLPKDSADINRLDKEKLDLFCYPLDYDVEQWGDYYHDPSIPEDQPTWQYTRVPVGYDFPNVQYEILDTCYIPDDDDEVETRLAGNAFSLGELEDAAYEHSGNGDMLVKDELRAKHSPCGTFTVYNDVTGKYEGVSGIAVRMGKFVKWFHVYTDRDGYYFTKATFRTDPHYWIYFDNKKDFKIGSWSVFANARLCAMGKHSNKGYSHAFNKGSEMWAHCLVNNATYYMYENFESYIPSDMRLWVLDNSGKGSAAMLGHNTASKLKVKAVMGAALGLGAGAVDQLIPALTALAPDIVVGAEGRDAYSLYECTCHELSHSMHFKKVGKKYWDKYIDGIIELRNNSLYGKSDSDSQYSGYIGVGETWGFAMGFYMANKKLSRSYLPDDYWFKPIKTKKLLDNKDITPLQFLSCMEGSVTDLHLLNTALSSKYNISNNLYY